MHRRLVFTTGKQLVVSTNNIVNNWQAASCEYKQYCDVVLPKRIYREKGGQFDENMKKYKEDDVNYCVVRRSRQHSVKLGNYAMRLT